MERSPVYRPCTHQNGFTFSECMRKAPWRSSSPERIAAAHCNNDSSSSSHAVKTQDTARETFPETLTLPGDALDVDHFEVEKCYAQTFTNWYDEPHRNPVTSQRRTIYIAAPPTINKSLDDVSHWAKPQRGTSRGAPVQHPQLCDVVRYLSAFYWPLPVKQAQDFEFTTWDEDEHAVRKSGSGSRRKRRKSNNAESIGISAPSKYIALQERGSGNATRITTRSAPPGQPYTRQLSTNDIIDALIHNLPKNAYALVLLLEHDLYEDGDDDFIIGRAYGGSRVAVVSMARYNPGLDVFQGVERRHSWPLSHCVEFLRSSGAKVTKSRTVHVKSGEASDQSTPMMAAIAYELAYDPGSKIPAFELKKLWLHRVCRTTSHELGHCFGLDHCLYYACIMQSSANAAEDARQPGYLCPVDLSKVLDATRPKGGEIERCRKMLDACTYLGPGGGFGALGAWVETRVRQLADRSPGTEAVEVIEID